MFRGEKENNKLDIITSNKIIFVLIILLLITKEVIITPEIFPYLKKNINEDISKYNLYIIFFNYR